MKPMSQYLSSTLSRVGLHPDQMQKRLGWMKDLKVPKGTTITVTAGCQGCPFNHYHTCKHPSTKRGKALSPMYYPIPPAWCKREK
jgi:hypothetical protein